MDKSIIDHNKIKVCFVQAHVYPFFDKKINATIGGAELQLYLIGTEIAKDNGYEVSYLVGDYGQPKTVQHGNISLFNGIPTKKGLSLLKKISSALKIYRILGRINADIYISSGANSVIGLVSYFCLHKGKIHIYRTSHKNGCNKVYINQNGLTGKIFQYGLEHANFVITQSKEHQILLKQHHNRNSKVFRNIFPIQTQKNGLKKKTILWVARIAHWKQPELFIELAKLFPSEKFVMVCATSKEDVHYQNKIQSMIKQQSNIKLYNQVPYDQVQKIFNEAKIFVNTSMAEGFPNTFLQAGVGKTPIVSLNVNPDGFIEQYNCGYFCQNNFNNMVLKIRILLKQRDDWQKKSENLYNYVRNNHDLSRNVAYLKQLIRYFISESKSLK
ncbi:MAG: glycosyltransferase [Patescibacteria group bacterium]|jgi:glycosyltransferase involved in cell wall biosynthesis